MKRRGERKWDRIPNEPDWKANFTPDGEHWQCIWHIGGIDGPRCRNETGAYANVCQIHGNRRSHTRNYINICKVDAKVDKKLARIAEKHGIAPVLNVYEELAQLGGVLKTREELLRDATETLEAGTPTYQAWERAIDRLVKMYLDISKINLEERKLGYSRRQVDSLLEDFLAVLGECFDLIRAALPKQFHILLDPVERRAPELLRRRMMEQAVA